MRLFLSGLFLLFLPHFAFSQVPVANFTASTTQGCAPLLVQFTNTSTGTNSNATYSWNFNNGGGTVVVSNPSTTFTNPGTYSVTLTVTNPGAGGGSNTKTSTAYITVLAPPAVSWTAADTTGCPPHTVSFNNTSSPASGLTYLWSFGDGSNSTATNPTHTYTTSGTYSVTLLATNFNGCSRTVVRPGNVKIWSKPQVFFNANPATLCTTPTTVAFTSSLSGGQQPYVYAWDFGNGSTSTATNPTNTYNSAGPFDVKLIVTDVRGCADTLFKPAYIQGTNTQANFTFPTVCAGAPITFTNTSSPTPTAAEWSFGSGAIPSTSTGISPTTTFATPGTYSVKLVTTGLGGCKDSITKSVTIVGGPPVSFSASPTDPCGVPAVVSFTNTTSGAVSYEWHFGDGGSSTATNPSHTYNNYGFFTDTLIATNATGCTTTLIKPDYIKVRNIISKLKPDIIEGCVPLTVTFKHTLETSLPTPAPAYPFPISTYNWNFGVAGATSTSAQPTYTFTTAGTYTVKVTSVTANGCTVIDSVIIKVGTLPTAGFTYTPAVQCTHQPIQFTNTSTGAQYYQWEMGDNASLTVTNPNYAYPTPGTYTVILKAFNNGCLDTFMVVNAVTINPPNAVFIPTYSCDTPKKVEFVNQSIGTTSQIWNFGDGATSTAASPIHTYTALGNYTVRLVTFNSTYGCSDTSARTITLVDGTASFIADDTTVCTGDTVHFTGSFAGGTALEYHWEKQVGNTYVSFDTNKLSTVSLVYPTRGKWGVRVIVFDAQSCPDTFTRAGYITAARPLVGFKVSDTIGCVPFKPLFTDTSKNAPGVAAAIRNWKWGNGASSLALKDTVSYTYNTAGNYTITLKVTDSLGCSDSLTKVAYVSARKPAAAFTINDTSACIGQPLQFTSTTTGTAPLTTSWSFGNGTTATTAQPIYAYTATGSYNVKLVVTDAAGCKDSLTKTAAVTVTRPTASFTVSDSQAICPPLLAQFTNTSTGALYYNWTFNNGSSSVLPNPSVVYTAIGQYPAQLVVTNAQGCKDTATRTIKVLGFAGAITYTPLLGCAPMQVQFTANVANVPSMIWDFNDGITTTATGTTISHTYTTPGAYIPKLLISDGNGCVTSSTGLDTLKVDGVRPGFKTSPACLGSPITFTDTSRGVFSTISSRTWRFPNGQVSTAPNPTYPATGLGSFTVVLISKNANGCIDSVAQQVTVTAPPVISAGKDTAVCLNDAVGLQATGGVTYLWSPAFNLNNAASPTPQASPTSNTAYTLVGTDAAGCLGRDTVFVRVKTKTTAATGGDVKVCAGSAVQLTGSGGTQYVWSPAGSLDNATSATPLAAPKENTTYTLIVKEGSCIPDTAQVKVTVNPTPQVDAGPDLNLVSGGSVTIVANSVNAELFRWYPPEGLGCTDCAATSASPTQTITYQLTGTNKFGCSDSDAITVFVQCNGNQMFIPNTFTPNGDGENDVFYPHGNGITQVVNMRIYNRWGEVVFQKSGFQMNDKSAGWDGSFNGQSLPPDAFIYTIDALCPNGETISTKGNVTLIR